MMQDQERATLMEKLSLGLKRSWWGEAMWCSKAGIGKYCFEEMTNAEARWVLEKMTFYGLMRSDIRGQNGRNGPTASQWERLKALATALDWQGMDDPRMVKLIRQAVGVDHPRFLSRKLMHQALAALRACRDASKKRKASKADQAPQSDYQNTIAAVQGETA